MTPAPTNPEQVCPRSPSGKSHAYATNGDECLMCGTGRVAAKPEFCQDCYNRGQMGTCPKHAPAPVDQPDELATILANDYISSRTDTLLAAIRALIAREREAAAKEAEIRTLDKVLAKKYRPHDSGYEFILAREVQAMLAALDTPAGEETSR